MQFQDREGYLAAVLDGAAGIREAPYEEPHAPSIARGLAAPAGAIIVAAAAMFRRKLRRTIPLPGAGTLERVVRPLRDLHSGLIGDYAAWLTAGVAAYGVLLFLLLS